MWVASGLGEHCRDFQGQKVKGRIQDISQPFIFSARSTLHATQDWEPNNNRLVLVACTPDWPKSSTSPNPNPARSLDPNESYPISFP